VAGAVIMVVVLVVVIPVGFLMLAAALTVLMGWLLHRNGEVTHAGSELLKLNR
jgi:hypothetical protein